MKNKKILFIICFLLTGCSLFTSGNDELKNRIIDHCKDNKCEFISFVAEVEIEEIGSYAVAKVDSGDEEKLMYAWHNLPTKKNPQEIISSKIYTDDYQMFENLDADYGHGFNYYIYMIHSPVDSVKYKNEKLKKETFEFTLNDNEEEITVVIIKLKAPEVFDETQLVIK